MLNPYSTEGDRSHEASMAERAAPPSTIVSRLPLSILIVSVGVFLLIANELLIFRINWGQKLENVNRIWVIFSLSLIGSGIGYCLRRRTGALLGAIIGPIIIYPILIVLLMMFILITGVRFFGD